MTDHANQTDENSLHFVCQYGYAHDWIRLAGAYIPTVQLTATEVASMIWRDEIIRAVASDTMNAAIHSRLAEVESEWRKAVNAARWLAWNSEGTPVPDWVDAVVNDPTVKHARPTESDQVDQLRKALHKLVTQYHHTLHSGVGLHWCKDDVCTGVCSILGLRLRQSSGQI